MIPVDRPILLDALARLASRDAETLDPLTTFLPLASHRRALADEVVVVLGGRGAGKTALFKLVNDPQGSSRLRAFFENDRIPEATWVDAFSQASWRHPEVGTLEARAVGASDITLRTFWMAHLLRRVNDELPGIAKLPPELQIVLTAPAADVSAWLPTAEVNLGAINAALDAVDRELQARDRSVVAAYDNLDRLGQFDPTIRKRYVSTLLSLWLSLSSRYRRLRGKVFLRDDLFDAGELGFADATKLRPRSEAITWDHTSLYRVALRHLANPSDPAHAGAIRAWLGEIPDLVLHDRAEFGWMPGDLSDRAQQFFAGRLAGKVIGKGVLKSYTSKWIVGRLRDSLGRITPRSMLWFLGYAAEEARKHAAPRKSVLMSPGDLLVALQRTSRERVQEVREEYDLVSRLENLRAMTIPLERAAVVERLGRPRAGEPQGIPTQGDLILGELVRLGVLKSSKEGQIDVPDIYRYSFEIAPDYTTAWKDFLTETNDSARLQLIRELPDLGNIFQRNGGKDRWTGVGAEEIDRKDFASAIRKCELALDAAQSANDTNGEFEVSFQLHAIHLSQKDFEKASLLLSRLLSLATKIGTTEHALRALKQVFLEKIRNNKHEDALGILDTAQSFAHTKQDAYEEAFFWMLKGITQEALQRPTDAEVSLKKALSVGQTANHKISELRTLDGMFIVAQNRESDTQALALATLAIAIAENLDGEILASFSSKQSAAAARLGYGPDRIEQIRREMEEEYRKDRGWSLVQSIFPG